MGYVPGRRAEGVQAALRKDGVLEFLYPTECYEEAWYFQHLWFNDTPGVLSVTRSLVCDESHHDYGKLLGCHFSLSGFQTGMEEVFYHVVVDVTAQGRITFLLTGVQAESFAKIYYLSSYDDNAGPEDELPPVAIVSYF